jgi:hypothetical protein
MDRENAFYILDGVKSGSLSVEEALMMLGFQ